MDDKQKELNEYWNQLEGIPHTTRLCLYAVEHDRVYRLNEFAPKDKKVV